MKKTRFVVLAIIIVAAIVVPIYLWQSDGGELDSADVSEIHERLDPDDIPKLKDLILSDSDNYTRERAVFTLTDIAVRKDVAEEVIEFLKEVALTDRNTDIRVAAYTNLELIRELNPPASRGNMTVSVFGEIREGSAIVIAAHAYASAEAQKAAVAVRRAVRLGAEVAEGIGLLSRNPVRFALEAGGTADAFFNFSLLEEGEYLIILTLDLIFGDIDYETIEKVVYLQVEETKGIYRVL